MGLYQYSIQLVDARTGQNIITAGGAFLVVAAGDTSEVALKDSTGAAASNPTTPTRGHLSFYTATTVSSVDVYGFAPGGQYVVAKGLTASGPNEILVDTGAVLQVARIPFSVADQAGDATETDTGLDLPTNALVLPDGVAVQVTTYDATETIDVGLLSSESGGDANGFIAAISVGSSTNAMVAALTTVSSGLVVSSTIGALLATVSSGTTTSDRGLETKIPHRIDGTAKSISWTLTAGADTAEGVIHIPYMLSNPS